MVGEVIVMMKKNAFFYSLIIIEIVVILILKIMNIAVHSWIGNAVGTFVCLLPIEMLLFKLGRDVRYERKKQVWFKVIFWWIALCYFMGGIATLGELHYGNDFILPS